MFSSIRVNNLASNRTIRTEPRIDAFALLPETDLVTSEAFNLSLIGVGPSLKRYLVDVCCSIYYWNKNKPRGDERISRARPRWTIYPSKQR